jgi:DNA circularisation protein
VAATAWQSQLLPASFRGAAFVVLGADERGGRRIADHEYPFRDIPWAEDLGRRGREYRFTGYVVGDDASAQRDAVTAACEQKGPGSLIHPTLGFLQVACAEFETEERWDKGRVIAFRFFFVEAGQLFYPTTGADTQAASNTAADNLSAAADKDLAQKTGTVDIGAGGSQAASGGSELGGGSSPAGSPGAVDVLTGSSSMQAQVATIAESEKTVALPPGAAEAGAGPGTVDTPSAHAAEGAVLDTPAPSGATAAAPGNPLLAPAGDDLNTQFPGLISVVPGL